MSYDIYNSISKGCFSFPATCNVQFNLHSADNKERLKLSTKYLQNIKNEFSAIQHQSIKKLSKNIIDFFKSKRIKGIHTALIVKGANVSDHEFMFSSLGDQLHQLFSSIVVHLSKYTSMKLMMQAMCQQIDDEHNWPTFPTIENIQEHVNDKRIVIIIKDFADFKFEQLEALLISLSNSSLNCRLIFGLTSGNLHQYLSYQELSLLNPTYFHATTSCELLDSLFQRLVLESCVPFAIGPNTLQFLFDTFLFSDSSVSLFLAHLEYCIVTHFHLNPLSVLCHKKPLRFFEKNKHDEIFKGIHPNDVKAAFESFTDYCNRLCAISKFILQQKSLQISRFYDSYQLCVTNNVINESSYQNFIAAIPALSLKDCIKLTDDLKELNVVDNEELDCLVDALNKDSKKASTPVTFVENKKLTLKQLQAKLVQQQTGNAIYKTKCKLQNLVKHAFNVCLEKVENAPLIKIWIIDVPLENLSVSPSTCIRTTLSSDDDIAINHVYQLLQENTGKSVNLFDLLVAYLAKTEQKSLKKMNSDNKYVIDEQMYAKFVDAVLQLQFLGFVKSSRHKADHLTKLTWC